ncbi:unnamed protein product [Larinioides sclopetarius]|uniref:Uncharacterized protein n=1 Tax=Larinioides sclopetarius TaxID=280406 RepID=A0AAV2AIC1_9ARAC
MNSQRKLIKDFFGFIIFKMLFRSEREVLLWRSSLQTTL